MNSRSPLLRVGALPLFVLLCAPHARAADAPASLLTNSALTDANGDGAPDGWELHPGGNDKDTFLKMAPDDGAIQIIDKDANGGVGLRQFAPAVPGREYAFSVESRGGGLFLYLNFRDDKRNIIGGEHRTPVIAGDDWHPRTIRQIAPPATAFVEVWIYAASDTITDVRLKNPTLRDNGTATTKIGPLTSDKEFFDALDLDFLGLEAVKAAAGRGDYAAAQAAYLEFRRTGSRARFQLSYRPEKPATDEIYPLPLPAPPDVAARDKAADAILKHQIAMPWGTDRKAYDVGENINWTFNPNAPTDPNYTIEWTYIALNRFYFWNNLADAYWNTRDEDYAKEWVAQLRDWVADNPVPLDAAPADTVTWRGIEAATRMNEAWPYAYFHFLQSPTFTPDANLIYAKSSLEHGQRLQRILTDFPDHGGNWVAMELRGLTTIASLFPEFKSSQGWLKLSFERLNREITAQVYPDGGQTELSTSYQQSARENFAGAASIAALNDAATPGEFMARFRAMYEWNLALMDQRGVLPPLNDAGEYDEKVGKSLRTAYNLWKDPKFLWGATLGKEGTAPPTSSFLPYSGYYAMRGGWKPDDLYLFFDAGPVGTGHWHEDMLNLYLRAYNKTLLTEAGGYAYDQSPMRAYVVGTSAHNTVTVDGKDQRRGQEHAAPETAPTNSKWASTPLFDYAAGTYDAGYQEARYKAVPYFPVEYVGDKDRSITHTRHVIFLKPYYALAVDFLDGDGQSEHRYDAYFHLDAPDARLDETTKAVQTLRTDGAQLGLYPLDATGLGARIAQGQTEPMLGWDAWRKRAIPTVVYTKSGAAPASFSTLLYPYQGQAPKVTSVAPYDNDGKVWMRRIETPRETVEVILRRQAGNEIVASQKSLVRGMLMTDASCTVLRQSKAGGPLWIGLSKAKRLTAGNLELRMEAPFDLVAAQSAPNEVTLFNSQSEAISVQIIGPFLRKVTLAPGVWSRVTAQGASVMAEAPELFAAQ